MECQSFSFRFQSFLERIILNNERDKAGDKALVAYFKVPETAEEGNFRSAEIQTRCPRRVTMKLTFLRKEEERKKTERKRKQRSGNKETKNEKRKERKMRK
jgi:hypothetical protein